jgi:hypothetical protein
MKALPSKFIIGTFSAINGGILQYTDLANITRANNMIVGLSGI